MNTKDILKKKLIELKREIEITEEEAEKEFETYIEDIRRKFINGKIKELKLEYDDSFNTYITTYDVMKGVPEVDIDIPTISG